MPNTVRLIPPEGGAAREVAADQAQALTERGWTPESTQQRVAQTVDAAREEYFTSPQAKVGAVVLGAGRTATGGITDAAIRTFGSDQDREIAAGIREANPYLSTGAEIAGSFTGVGALASGAGAGVSKAIGEGSTAAKLAGAGLGTATEGALFGAQQGVSELALSDDPLTLERAASVLKTNILYGAGTGGALGVAGKGIELGLSRAKQALDKVAIDGTGAASNDLAALDRKGLRAAEKTEVDAIEAARIPERAKVADELSAFRKELKEQKVWLAAKGAEDAEIKASAINKRLLKADKRIDNLLDDPKVLAENPKSALSALRTQEAALDDLVNKHGAKLRASFAADESGVRAASLDKAATALEKNRALQAKIVDLSAKPASERLTQITDALEGLNAPKSSTSMGDTLGGLALGHMVSAATGIPYLGPAVVAGKAVAGVVKKLGANTAQLAERGSKAITTFLDATKHAAPARVVATKTLSSVAYAANKPAAGKQSLADLYHARSSEIRELTAPGPTGVPEMRMEARQKMAARLAPLRAANPIAADRIETNRANAVAFLASKLPRKPDLPGMGAHDGWQPSDMEMRGWARYVAAVEDPHGVIERLASGEVTPEDAEAMRSVYPEMYAQVQREIMGQLGELQARLPYKRRLALSIFSGIPVDPAMDPRVLSILQGSFAAEQGTQMGTQAPRAQPAFGSVSKEKPTPAQERAG